MLQNPSTTNLAKTILLGVVPDDLNATNTLIWDSYIGWIGGVNNYEIYRSVGGIFEPNPIATIDVDSPRVYVDNIANITRGSGEFCYRVEANEGAAFRVGGLQAATSSSNEACTIHQPLVYIPNAFDPFSEFNPSFKPVLTFADPLAYELIIFNRKGQEVFKTNDVAEGWRGQDRNSREIAPLGVYSYQIRFTSASGEPFEKNGHVTLIR